MKYDENWAKAWGSSESAMRDLDQAQKLIAGVQPAVQMFLQNAMAKVKDVQNRLIKLSDAFDIDGDTDEERYN